MPNDLTKVAIPQCIPDALRAPLTALARIANRLLPLKELVTTGATPTISIDVGDLSAQGNVTDPGSVTISTQVAQSFYIEGTLDGDLTRDGTQTLNLIDPSTDAAYSPNKTATVNGFFVPTGKKVPSGARVGAQFNGVNWRVKVTDTCVVNA